MRVVPLILVVAFAHGHAELARCAAGTTCHDDDDDAVEDLSSMLQSPFATPRQQLVDKHMESVATSACLRDKPVPLIFVANGRGGTTVMLDIINKLTGSHNLSFELPGRNTSEQEQFFDDSSCLANIISFLCEKQRDHPNDSFVGFKWKPDYIEGPNFHAAWDWVTSHNVKIIYSTRNTLDRIISKVMHKHSGGLWHCMKSDISCIEEKFSTSPINLNTNSLVKRLQKETEHESKVEELLRLTAHYSSFKYEDLMTGPDATRVAEWKRLLTYLDQPSDYLTAQDLARATNFTATSPQSQSTKVANYAEVVQLLHNTEFADLLH